MDDASYPPDPRGQDVTLGEDPTATRLYDFSRGRLDLEGRRARGDLGHHTRHLVQTLPGLPDSPVRTTEAQWQQAMSWAQLGVVSVRPRPIPELEFQARDGWVRLPAPSPVWANVRDLGTSMAYFWRRDQLARDVLYLAVHKLYPMGFDASDPYAGLTLEVFAAWCQPMKWAVHTLGNARGEVTMLTDDGEQFSLPMEEFRASRDPRLAVARNAVARDYPAFMRGFLALHAIAPPELIGQELALYPQPK